MRTKLNSEKERKTEKDTEKVNCKIKIQKMFEDIFTNPGFDHLTECIVLDLDVTSLLRCRLVCKDLNRFIKSMEKSRKLRERDFR